VKSRVFSVFFGMLKFWHPKILARRYFGDSPVFNPLASKEAKMALC
jgi:hypothetical protein